MGDKAKIKHVEDTKGIELSKTHFFSLEGTKTVHCPTYWVNPGKLGENHITIALFEGDYYLVKPTGKPFDRPIPFAKSGRE